MQIRMIPSNDDVYDPRHFKITLDVLVDNDLGCSHENVIENALEQAKSEQFKIVQASYDEI